MYNNLTVIFTFKYVQKVTVNRRILTRHLTISCQIHIYVALQRTNGTATQSSLEEMYVHHRGPSCKRHTTLLQKSSGNSASLPANGGAMKKKTKSSSSHHMRWDTRDSGWGLKDGRSTSTIHLNTTNKSKTRHFLLNLVDFLFVLFFYTDFVKTKF